MSEEEFNVDPASFDSLIICLLQCCWKRSNRLEGFGDMEILEELGHGGSGKVFRCRDRNSTGSIFAVKQIQIREARNGIPSFIFREVSVLGKLHHVNIVRLLNVVVTDHIKHVYLVFELLDFDLHQYIRNRSHALDSMTIKMFLHQILSAVAYCHSHQIIHRDLKPKNLLIDRSRNIIKLADFGQAREFGDANQITGKIGTPWYRAPEILFDSPYSTPVDLWSVGCIFGQMVIRNPIFQALHHNWQDELEAIFRVLGTPTEETWPGVTGFNDYPKYGQYNPLDLSTIFARVGADGIDLLTRMLTLDPNQRISADAALEHAYFSDLISLSLPASCC